MLFSSFLICTESGWQPCVDLIHFLNDKLQMMNDYIVGAFFVKKCCRFLVAQITGSRIQ